MGMNNSEVLKDFPGVTVDKNLSANAGDMGLTPGLGKSTCCGATQPTFHNYWACALKQLKPAHLESVDQLAAARESLPSCNEDPVQPKVNKQEMLD